MSVNKFQSHQTFHNCQQFNLLWLLVTQNLSNWTVKSMEIQDILKLIKKLVHIDSNKYSCYNLKQPSFLNSARSDDGEISWSSKKMTAQIVMIKASYSLDLFMPLSPLYDVPIVIYSLKYSLKWRIVCVLCKGLT